MNWPTVMKRLRPESLQSAFGPLKKARTERLLSISVLLFLCIVALRLVMAPQNLVLVLFVAPIALVAIALGTGGGLVAATLSYAAFVLVSLAGHVDTTWFDHAGRAVCFFLVGGLVGYYSEQGRRFEDQASRWFELSRGLACTAGFDGYFKRINPAFERALGYSQAELLSKPLIEFVHPEDREATALMNSTLADGADVLGFQNRYLAKDGSVHWIEWMSASVPSEQLVYAAAKDVTETKHLEEQLWSMAQQDPLTGLFNRRRFDEEICEQLARVRRNGKSAALLVFDLDRFKEVNDTYGHAAGDDVLRDVGRLLTEGLRDIDLAARLGGDEFAVLLPDTDAAGAQQVAVNLLAAMRERSGGWKRVSIPVRLSVGIALIEPETSSEEAVSKEADHALYCAKERGGDRFSLFSRDEDISDRSRRTGAPPKRHLRLARPQPKETSDTLASASRR